MKCPYERVENFLVERVSILEDRFHFGTNLTDYNTGKLFEARLCLTVFRSFKNEFLKTDEKIEGEGGFYCEKSITVREKGSL